MAPAPRILLALVVYVLVSVCHGTDYGWQPRKEFSFSVEGRDVAGLPQLKAQFAGLTYRGELRVQTLSPRVLLLKVLNMSYTNFHEELAEGWWSGQSDSSRNRSRLLPLPSYTVVIKMTKSTSPELIIDANLEDWQVSFIKGLVSKIIVSLKDDSVAGPNTEWLPREQQQVFSVMEDSVVGRCEVLYEISPLATGLLINDQCDDRPLWEITKTTNFSNCQVLGEDHLHLPAKDCIPGGSRCGEFWTRASLTQLVGCGELSNFVLLSSVTSSVINAHLHLRKDSQAVLNSNLNITLQSITDFKQKFDSLQNTRTYTSLFYSYLKSPKDTTNPGITSESNDYNKLEEEHSNDKNEQYSTVQYKNKEESSRGKSKTSTKHGKTNQYDNTDYKKTRPIFDTSNSLNKNRKPIQEKSWKLSDKIRKQSSEEVELEDHWQISDDANRAEPVHQPFNMLALAKMRPDEPPCQIHDLRQVVIDISNDLQDINTIPEKHIMDKLSWAVDICRIMPLDDLNSVNQELFIRRTGNSATTDSKQRSVFRDVIAMCGTHPAFQVIKDWIERHQVEGEEATQIIASLPSHIYSPNQALIRDFFEMVQQISKEDNMQLTTTAVLALSNLVRQACIDERTRKSHFSSIVRPICHPNFTKDLINWLVDRLDSDFKQSRVFVEALGNVGSSDSMKVLQGIATNPKYSSYIQTSAVLAMRYLSMHKAPGLNSVLLAVYHNYSLAVSARMAAVAVLVYSDPGLAVWQRLAISTWYEPSPIVAHFVTTSIRSMASTQDTLYTHIGKNAKLVLHLAKPSDMRPYRPHNVLSSWHSSDFGKVVLEQLSWMQLSDFSNHYYRHSSRSCGFSRTNFEVSLSSSNLDDLWSALKETIFSATTNNNYRPPTAKGGVNESLQELQQLLNIPLETMPDLQADLHLRINNIVERMFIINKDTFKSWAIGSSRLLKEILTEGKIMSYQKADMDSFQISTITDLGFPIEFRVRTPWIIQAKASLNVTEEGLVLETAFMYSSQLLSSLGVMSPWDGMAHTVGAYATNFLQLPPFRLAATIDNPRKKIKLSSKHMQQHRLLYVAMQPFTSQHKVTLYQPLLLSPGTIRIHLGQSVQVPISWLSWYLKSVYSSEETDNIKLVEWFREARGVVSFPLLMPDMVARSFETVMDPIHPIHMNLSMSMVTKVDGLLEYTDLVETLLGKMFYGLTTPKDYQGMANLLSYVNNFKEINNNNSKESEINMNSTEMRESTSNGNESKVDLKAEEKPVERNGGIDAAVNSGGFRVYHITYNSPSGNFNASAVNPFTQTVNGSSHSYLLDQSLSMINSGEAVVFEFSMHASNPERPINIAAFATYARTYSKRADRLGLFLKKDNSQVRMTVCHEDPVDIARNLSRRINEDLQHNILIDYAMTSPVGDVKASLKASLGASRTTLEQLKSSQLLSECSQLDIQHFDSSVDPKCQEIQMKIKDIGFGDITIYYNEQGKLLENLVNMYISTARVMIPRTEIKNGHGLNMMTATFDYTSSGSLSIQIATSASSLTLRRLPQDSIPLSPVVNWLRQQHIPQEYCGISVRRIKTWNGPQLEYQMNDDWHLIAYDFSRKHNFSISARAANTSLEVKVNIGDEYLLSMKEGPTVLLNHAQQSLNSSQPLLRVFDWNLNLLAHVVYTPDSSIHIRLPRDELDLIYHGTTLIIRAGAVLQGRLGGLCGSYASSGVEQLLNSQRTPSKTSREFIHSYIMNYSSQNQVDISN